MNPTSPTLIPGSPSSTRLHRAPPGSTWAPPAQPQPRHPAATLQVRQTRAEAQDLRELTQAIASRHLRPVVAAYVLTSAVTI